MSDLNITQQKGDRMSNRFLKVMFKMFDNLITPKLPGPPGPVQCSSPERLVHPSRCPASQFPPAPATPPRNLPPPPQEAAHWPWLCPCSPRCRHPNLREFAWNPEILQVLMWKYSILPQYPQFIWPCNNGENIWTYENMIKMWIKGPDNPTTQLLPIIRKSGWNGREKRERTMEIYGDGGGSMILKNCMWRVVCVCDKVVCERLCVWQNCAWKVVCDKVVCERVVCDKFVCAKAAWKSSVCIRERWTHLQRGCHQAPRLPRKTEIDVSKSHACYANRRWMSESATPATQMERRCRQMPRLPRKVPPRHGRQNFDQAHHQTQPSAIRTMPATQNEGR